MKMYQRILSTLTLLTSITLSSGYAVANEHSVVNINTATAEELAKHMKGVGEKRAQAIVEYREQHGPFAQIDDLLAVDGIGDATLARNRDTLVVE